MKTKLVTNNIRSHFTTNLLRQRGVENPEHFLNPTMNDIQNFGDLDNIENGVDLIYQFQNGKCAVIVDSDCDGFTSAAIIINYLARVCPNLKCDFYLHDGKQHGLEDKYELLSQSEYDFVICPDSATNDCNYAKELECPVLVLDHHIWEKEKYPFSKNMIVINNQCSPYYLNKNLSGAGVVYQFCRALDKKFYTNYANEFLDLAALGVCGDMMSGLSIENQAIWKYGFSSLNNTMFKALVDKQSYSMGGVVNPMTVAFYICPLINGMIRAGTLEEKERLFLSFINPELDVVSHKRGAKGAQEKVYIESIRECVNARSRQNKIKDEAVKRITSKILKYDLLNNQILFIRLDNDDDFPSELNGLVAMQLSKEYHRPTIVARLNDEGWIRGSARGLNNSAIESFKDYLTNTGLFEYATGHDNAFGISIANNNLSKLHLVANEELGKYNFNDLYYNVDFQFNGVDVHIEDAIKDVTENENIWSQGNPEPIFFVENLFFSKKDWTIMGKNKDTIKFVKNGVVYIKFNADDLIQQISSMDEVKLQIVGTAHINVWNGMITPQIFISDYELAESSIFDF